MYKKNKTPIGFLKKNWNIFQEEIKPLNNPIQD
jgi:hypothetical protein